MAASPLGVPTSGPALRPAHGSPRCADVRRKRASRTGDVEAFEVLLVDRRYLLFLSPAGNSCVSSASDAGEMQRSRI